MGLSGKNGGVRRRGAPDSQPSGPARRGRRALQMTASPAANTGTSEGGQSFPGKSAKKARLPVAFSADVWYNDMEHLL